MCLNIVSVTSQMSFLTCTVRSKKKNCTNEYSLYLSKECHNKQFLFMIFGSFDHLSRSLAHFPTFRSVLELIVRDQRENKGGLFVFVLQSNLLALGSRWSD